MKFEEIFDKEVEKQFNDVDYKVGELFVTSSGDLHYDYIINVATKFEYEDSSDLTL